ALVLRSGTDRSASFQSGAVAGGDDADSAGGARLRGARARSTSRRATPAVHVRRPHVAAGQRWRRTERGLHTDRSAGLDDSGTHAGARGGRGPGAAWVRSVTRPAVSRAAARTG